MVRSKRGGGYLFLFLLALVQETHFWEKQNNNQRLLKFNPINLPLPLIQEILIKAAWVSCAMKDWVIGLPVVVLNLHARMN